VFLCIYAEIFKSVLFRRELSQRSPIEIEIINKLKAADQQAIALIYDNYGGALFGLCLKMMGSKEDAEEVLQEALTKIWRFAQSYDPDKARLYTWMINITRNTCIDQIRKNDRRPQIQDVDSSVYESGASVKTETPVDHIGLKEELAKLREEDRKVLELAYFYGYSQSEIAKKLRLPIGTVKTRARKAINELKTRLAKDIGS